MKIYDTLNLTDPKTVLGNHGVWLPDQQIKIPFQWGGRITKLSRPGEQFGDRESIVDEVCILRALAKEGVAPRVGDIVFFQNVISTYPGAWHCDPMGAFGYEIADANALKPGRFYRDVLEKLPVKGSPAAWGDVVKKDNIINGYLIDVRRSSHDLLKWEGPRFQLPSFDKAEVEKLRLQVHRECQFPAGERNLAYQDFWIDGKLEKGQRRVIERAQQLSFRPKPGDSVLDIGTQSGSFLQHAWYEMKGQGKWVGVEIDGKYVSNARSLMRSCGQNICIRKMDVVRDRKEFVSWVKSYFPQGIDHVLALSMEKHIGESFLLELIDELRARNTYIETNAVAEDKGTGPEPPGPMKMMEEIKKRGGIYLDSSRDRNLRRLYRIMK